MIDIHPDDPAPSTSRLIPSSLSANATQPSDTKDIRNFFKPAVPLAEQRKPLAKVAVNRFKGKVKIEEEKNRPSPKQGFTSRFFGGASTSDRPPSATSVRSASIVLDESEDENDVEIITKQQPESLVLSKQEEDEADAMWARTQAAAGAEELLQEEPSRVLQDAPDLESPPRPTAASEELDSPGGSITSPEVSPLKQQLSPASPLQVHQTKHESEGDELSKLSDDFVFTSPAQTYPDSSTSPPSPQDKRTDQENSQDAPLLKFSPKKRKFSRLDLTSDIDDFSSPKQEAKPPPTKRRRSSPLHKASNSLRQSSGQPFPAQTSVDSDDEETVEAARSDEAAQKVAASLRSRFSFSSTSFSKSTSSSPSLTSISKRRGSVVAKNATTKDPTSRLKRAVNAALSQKQKNCTFNTPTEQSGGDQRPSAKLRRHHASMNTRAPGSSTSLAAPEETEKCTHWRKVDITSSTLASFKR